MLTSLLMGFLAKTIASLDDTLLRIPVFAVYTKTFKGKLYFSIGTLTATILVLGIALFLSTFLKNIPYTEEITIALIFLLSIFIWFNIGLPQNKKSKKNHQKIGYKFLVGFFISIASLIDDMLVMLPLFLTYSKVWIIVGALISTLIGIFVVFFFSGFLKKVKYKKEIAALSLAGYGIILLIQKIWFV